MNTTELGVYILGATALAILAAFAIATSNHAVMVSVALAAGAAYVSQNATATLARTIEQTGEANTTMVVVGGLFMVIAIACYCVGLWYLAA